MFEFLLLHTILPTLYYIQLKISKTVSKVLLSSFLLIVYSYLISITPSIFVSANWDCYIFFFIIIPIINTARQE